MPLKIGFIGNSLSGKTALSQRLAQKYGLVYINPVSIISEAF
jgi:adenylate kinase family enzyme